MRGKVESDRQALLASGQIGAIESIRFFCGREAGVLSQRPRLRKVHGRIGAPQKGCEARPITRQINAIAIARPIKRLDLDAFGRLPDSLLLRINRLRWHREWKCREVGDLTHEVTTSGDLVSTPVRR